MSPKVIYDIGAHQGNWTSETAKIFPSAQFFLFEANPSNESHLSRLSESRFIVTLSDKDGQRREFFTPKVGSNTGSSLYKAQSIDFDRENLRVISVDTRTLESFVRERKVPAPDFMKLDVQGSELDVLRGAGGLLSNCSALIAEVSLVQGNEGAPDPGDLINGIRDLGFRCVDLCKARRTMIGSVCEIDLLFVNQELYDKYLRMQLGRDS
jgi:FkbM family methyltransferase